MKKQTRLKHKVIVGISGRVLTTISPNVLYVCCKHRIYRSADSGGSWQLVGILPASLIRRCSGWFRPFQRLLRYELRSFAALENGSMLASSREGVYWADPGQIHFQPTRFPDSNRLVHSPQTITADCEGRFLWGEYIGYRLREPVGIYASFDNGGTHRLVHEFAAGQIRHVHQIVEDPYDKCFWVLTGDTDSESGILRLSWDLKDIEWIVRGKQLFRAVVAFPLKNKLIYATDSELDQNYICQLDKRTGALETICEIPGSCIYGCKCGCWYVISTTVECFRRFKTNQATLWISRDGLNWQQVWQAEKDNWPQKVFQYGSIVLPRRGWDRDLIVFSGQALKGIDGAICIAEIVEQESAL